MGKKPRINLLSKLKLGTEETNLKNAGESGFQERPAQPDLPFSLTPPKRNPFSTLSAFPQTKGEIAEKFIRG